MFLALLPALSCHVTYLVEFHRLPTLSAGAEPLFHIWNRQFSKGQMADRGPTGTGELSVLLSDQLTSTSLHSTNQSSIPLFFLNDIFSSKGYSLSLVNRKEDRISFKWRIRLSLGTSPSHLFLRHAHAVKQSYQIIRSSNIIIHPVSACQHLHTCQKILLHCAPRA